jgi:4-hydroxy-tetrahydrodipicolinate synthase
MSRNSPPGGVIAAVLLPRDEEGRPEWEEFERLVAFLCRCGVGGVCVNGATGEYARATPEERRTALAAARRAAGKGVIVIAGAGSACTRTTIERMRDAEEAGADAHLVPPPFFFRYRDDDLEQHYHAVAAAAERPILIYNLPSYLSPVSCPTVVELLRTEERVAGIKDSSGQLDILEHLTSDPALGAWRFVGNDWVLAEACRRQLADGAISGVACVLPELLVALWEAAQRGDWEATGRLERSLAEALQWIDAWPAPMGLQVLAEARGLRRCLPAAPLSAARMEQAKAMREWFEPWWEKQQETLAAPLLIHG